ncbi:prepilin-type N-terminal cleavage/methylation domain-containing protein [bacterium]|nr:prepilin-type N-terminal cleavage/methylation domain-containing protein [bacterium]
MHVRRALPFSRSRKSGFSLIEVMFATAIVALLFMAALSALYMHRIQAKKYQERAVVLDFATHYIEHLKGLPFSDLQPGSPINPLYDGQDGAPDIRVPTTDDWVSLSSDDFETFHPELVLLEARNPEISVSMTTTLDGSREKTKHVRVRIRWDSPMGKGRRMTAQLDMTRFVDV